MGPTAGYLFGYLVAAYVTGALFEKKHDSSRPRALLLLLLGNANFFLFGVPWLAYLIGWQKAILVGFLPFLPGDLLKCVLAARLCPLRKLGF